MSKRRERSDGAENRRLILLAARDAYTQSGAGVPLSEIAARAGVSRTTVSRHYRTRQDLERALMGEYVAQIEQRANELAGTAGGLRKLFRYVLELQFETRFFYPLDQHAAESDSQAFSVRVSQAFQNCLEAGGGPNSAQMPDLGDLLVAMRLGVGVGYPPPGLDEAGRRKAWDMLGRSVFGDDGGL